MTARDPSTVLRRALVAWGLGHFRLGHTRAGRALLAAEVGAALVVAWLAIGLADSSAYPVPFVAGISFVVAWAWQAVDAYRRARSSIAAIGPTPLRSPAPAMAWLSLPLLAWGAGFWLIGAQSATPAAVLDRFVRAWSVDDLTGNWRASVVQEAETAAAALGDGPDRFRDVRVTIVGRGDRRATAVAEATHYERRPTRFPAVFEGSELVPVSDAVVLTLELAAQSVELPGGGDIGAVRWELVDAHR